MIEVDGVDVTLGGERVLSGVDLSVDRGRLVGLVGPNGAGKTTLLRAINGRLSPARGRVRIDGDPVDDLPARELARRVATVPQETDLSFSFEVRDAVAMGRHPHRPRFGAGDPDPGAVERALERTGIADLADRPVTAASGGERQRVLLARALAQDTPALLLDEPTASLDINHRVAMLGLVCDLVDEEGKTALAAIHDLDLAARYCDELALLVDGRLRTVGPPGEVLTAERLGEAFDTRVAVGRDPVTGTPSVTAMAPPDGGRERVHVVAGGASGGRIVHALVAAGFEVAVGPVHATDPDAATADLLDLDAVTVPPFTPVDGAVEAAAESVRGADVAVLADLEVGPANAAALSAAGAADRLVVVEDRPFAERNHAGDRARRRYEALRDRAVVAGSGGVVEAVEAALDRPPRPERAAPETG